jgi:Branched-chain amino acid transport protein (AzlD)
VTWAAVLAACAACFGLKLAGHLVPAERLAGERWARLPALVTVALLSALVAVQTLADGGALRLDARVAALGAAAVALWLRAPFVVVVLVAALTAAGLRAVT